MLFTSRLVTPSCVYSFIKGTYKNWNLFTEGKMQVLKQYYFARLNFLQSICLQSGIFPSLDLPLSLKTVSVYFNDVLLSCVLGHALSLGFSLKRNLSYWLLFLQ